MKNKKYILVAVFSTTIAITFATLIKSPFVENSENSLTAAGNPVWLYRFGYVAEAADAQTSNAVTDLGGTSWQLVQFQGSDDTTLIPDDGTKYTIAFDADGGVSVRIDCNRGRGAWTSAGPNQLQFGPLALTRAMCPPGSLHDRIVRDWAAVRSYIIRENHLFLSLMADGGIYEFEPLSSSQPTPR